MMDYVGKEGEILFFGFDGAMCGMLSALCGVSGRADPRTSPRLCIGDGEDPDACRQCMRVAGAHRAAVLLIGGEVAGEYHLSRPFLFSEFRALLRKILSVPCGDSAGQSEPSLCRLTLSPDGWVAFGKGGCHLTPAEAQILRLLLQDAPSPVSRETLARALVGRRGNGVDVYISYLRRKLGGLTPNVGIVSVRGRGYALVGGESVQN